MKILLTGATGFLGYRTLERLVDEPGVDRIIANGRTIKPTHLVEHSKVSYITGDLSNSSFVESLVKQVDIIIHAAAFSSPWGPYLFFKEANLLSQQNLIRSAIDNNIKRYIYISTPSIYYNHQDCFNIKESDPLPQKMVNAYATTKWQAEEQLRMSGLSHIVLRPRALIGRGDTVIMPRLIRAFDEGRLKIIGNGENTVDLTSVANAVQAIVLSLHANDYAMNEAYNITNGTPVKLWEAIADILSKLDRKLGKKNIPFDIVNLVASVMEIKSRLTNMKEPSLTKYGVGVLAKSCTLDISKAKELLGYYPLVSTDEAIDEFVDWYKRYEKN